MISRKSRLLAILLSAVLFIGTAFIGVTAAPKRVKISKITVAKTGKSAKVTFKKVKGAKKYQVIYSYNKKFKISTLKTVKKNKSSVVLKNIKAGKTLYVKIRAKLKKGYSKYSKVIKIKIPKKITTTTATTTTITTATTTTTTTTTPAPTTTITTTLAPTTQVKTTVKPAPTLPANLPEIATTVARTQDGSGNPTDSFITSLNGFNLKILNPWANPVVGTPVYESAIFVEQNVENEFGCTIHEDGFYEGYTASLTASLSAGIPQAHIYRVQDTSFAGFFNKEYFCDLTQGMKTAGVDFKDPWYDIQSCAFFNINNKQIAWSGSDYDAYKIYYNKRLLENKGLDDPMTLVENGTWTWDKLISYSQNLNSVRVNGFTVMEGSPEILLKGMVTSYGKSITKVSKGASPTTNIEDRTVIDCLTDLYEWKTKGYVTLNSSTWDAAKKSFGNGLSAMIYGSSDVLNTINWAAFNSDVGVVPFPKPSSAQTKYYSVVKAQFPYFVPKQYETDAAKILFIFNEMQRQAYRFRERNFVINNAETFQSDSLEMLSNINNSKGNFAVINDWGTLCETGYPTTGFFAKNVAEGMYTAQGAVDLYGPSLIQAYEDVWAGKFITGDI